MGNKMLKLKKKFPSFKREVDSSSGGEKIKHSQGKKKEMKTLNPEPDFILLRFGFTRITDFYFWVL